MKDYYNHFAIRAAIFSWLVNGVLAWSRSDKSFSVSFHTGTRACTGSHSTNFLLFSSWSNSEFDQDYHKTKHFSKKMSLEDAILNRYACKKFRRYNDTSSSNTSDVAFHSNTASLSDPSVVQRASYCLDLARRTPTAFNTQPYKVVLVYTPEQKEKLSKFCLGPNRAKVLDSDCTAIFLADKQVFWTLPRFRQLLRSIGEKKSRKPLTRKALLKMQFYVTLFSSGYPLPRCVASPISFFVRTGVALVNLITKWFYPMPTLANAETWSSKQVTMVAMTYMLACSAQGLATVPMEGKSQKRLSAPQFCSRYLFFLNFITFFITGINAGGIRKVIRAPSRYAIPLIVSTGLPYTEIGATCSSVLNQDSLGRIYDRYRTDELLFGDSLGAPLPSYNMPTKT
jgi:nitroreductase